MAGAVNTARALSAGWGIMARADLGGGAGVLLKKVQTAP